MGIIKNLFEKYEAVDPLEGDEILQYLVRGERPITNLIGNKKANNEEFIDIGVWTDPEWNSLVKKYRDYLISNKTRKAFDKNCNEYYDVKEAILKAGPRRVKLEYYTFPSSKETFCGWSILS